VANHASALPILPAIEGTACGPCPTLVTGKDSKRVGLPKEAKKYKRGVRKPKSRLYLSR
jgi:hypothetical protein